MWLLKQHPDGESLLDSEEVRYYLFVNGRRAISARMKDEYGHIISIQRSAAKNEIKFIFEENRGANACVTEMTPTDDFPTKHAEAIIERFAALTQAVTVIPETQFDAPSSTDDDTQIGSTQSGSTQHTSTLLTCTQPSQPEPMMASTPIPQKRSRIQAERRKRLRRDSCSSDSSDSDKENSFSVEVKCKGRYKVNIDQLLKAPEGMLTKKVSDDSIGPIKTVLRDNRPQQLPIIPVMATGPWTGGVAPQDKFIVLGGYSLFMAAKDLSTDAKFADYGHLHVHIFCDVTGDEIHQVEALFGLQASLLKDGAESFESRVTAFREILFRICGVDRQEEPPKPRQKVSIQWRRMCAASIGKSTDRKALKPLEPTFQVAQYSNRCYEKVSRLFQIEQEKGKEVKQSIFISLCGLSEGERFRVLSSVVSGDVALKDVKAVAATKKMLQDMKQEMVQQLGASTWEEVRELYPLHSTDNILKPYRGMDFKNSLPRSFLKLIEAAKSWKASNTTLRTHEKLHFVRRGTVLSTPQRRMELAFINVKMDSDVAELEGILQSRTTLLYICEDVVLAGRTVEHLEKKEHTYAVLLNKEDGKVQHLVSTIWRPDGIVEKAPQMDSVLTLSDGFYNTQIERLSSVDDLIFVYGHITDAVVAATKQGRKIIAMTDSDEVEEEMRMMVQQASVTDTFDFDDNTPL